MRSSHPRQSAPVDFAGERLRVDWTTGSTPSNPGRTFRSTSIKAHFAFPLVPERLKKAMSESRWSVYVIRCGDGSLYTGIATDVNRRFGEHVSQGPKAAKYLRGRLPLEIVYRREIGSRSEAGKEELRIKRMGVKGKTGLVDGG
jgi:putative endonuclease